MVPRAFEQLPAEGTIILCDDSRAAEFSILYVGSHDLDVGGIIRKDLLQVVCMLVSFFAASRDDVSNRRSDLTLDRVCQVATVRAVSA